MQHLIVALIVLACTTYAAWTLMPASWRRGLAARALRLPGVAQLAPLAGWLRARAQGGGGGCAGGCADGGCAAPRTARTASTATPHSAPIRVHRRR